MKKIVKNCVPQHIHIKCCCNKVEIIFAFTQKHKKIILAMIPIRTQWNSCMLENRMAWRHASSSSLRVGVTWFSMEPDESKIYDHHKSEIVLNQEKTSCIYYAHWWQSVTDGAMVIEWAVNFRQKFCNALTIEHKYNDSLPINETHNNKREGNRS